MDAPLSASPLGQMSRPAGVAGGLQGTTRATTLWHEQETRNSGQGASTSSDPGDKLPAPGTIIAHRFPCTSCNCNAWTWLAFLVPDDEEVDEYKSVIDPGYQRRYEDFLVRQLGHVRRRQRRKVIQLGKRHVHHFRPMVRHKR